MQQIVNFLIRNKNFLLFLLLLFISLLLTIQSHSYHRSKFISSTNFISGGLYNWSASISDYLKLKGENQRLLEENNRLYNLLQKTPYIDTLLSSHDALQLPSSYHYRKARVINNSYNRLDNYITINKGSNDSINTDMGVITDKGIVGIIENTSSNYGRVISILNTNSRINAQLKKSDHYGSLIWNGQNPNVVQLEVIPRLAPVKIGDTIITGGRSTIFPKGIPIGTILYHELDADGSYYLIDVKLFNDMTNIGFVYCIENNNAPEIKQLETGEAQNE